jgi:hypothetical protein
MLLPRCVNRDFSNGSAGSQRRSMSPSARWPMTPANRMAARSDASKPSSRSTLSACWPRAGIGSSRQSQSADSGGGSRPRTGPTGEPMARAGDADHDQRRVRGPERLGLEAEAAGRAGREVPHEHVGAGHQAGERLNGDDGDALQRLHVCPPESSRVRSIGRIWPLTYFPVQAGGRRSRRFGNHLLLLGESNPVVRTGPGDSRPPGGRGRLTTAPPVWKSDTRLGEYNSPPGQEQEGWTVLTLKAAGLVDIDAGAIVRPGIQRIATRGGRCGPASPPDATSGCSSRPAATCSTWR